MLDESTIRYRRGYGEDEDENEGLEARRLLHTDMEAEREITLLEGEQLHIRPWELEACSCIIDAVAEKRPVAKRKQKRDVKLSVENASADENQDHMNANTHLVQLPGSAWLEPIAASAHSSPNTSPRAQDRTTRAKKRRNEIVTHPDFGDFTTFADIDPKVLEVPSRRRFVPPASSDSDEPSDLLDASEVRRPAWLVEPCSILNTPPQKVATLKQYDHIHLELLKDAEQDYYPV